jgi:hypothetical protein
MHSRKHQVCPLHSPPTLAHFPSTAPASDPAREDMTSAATVSAHLSEGPPCHWWESKRHHYHPGVESPESDREAGGAQSFRGLLGDITQEGVWILNDQVKPVCPAAESLRISPRPAVGSGSLAHWVEVSKQWSGLCLQDIPEPEAATLQR